MRSILAAVLAAALVGCATAHNYPPEVDGDVATFKVYLSLGVPDSAADQASVEDFETYRAAKGYRSWAVLDRRYVHVPTHIQYRVRFDR